MKRKVSTHIRNLSKSIAVIDFLVQRFTYHNRSSWRHQFERGRILINGLKAPPTALVKNGDYLEFALDNFQEPPVDNRFSIILEDHDLLIINKSGNLPCHPAGRYFNNTLWAALRPRQSGQKLHFVNRLDRETSGLVLIAKNQETALILQKSLINGKIHKVYLAVAEGAFPHPFMRAAGVLVRDEKSRIRKKLKFKQITQNVSSGSIEKICITKIRKLAVKNKISLLEVVAETGRLHQIRATFQGVGFPLVGDKLYGIDENLFIKFTEDRLTDKDRASLKMNRQALHAWKLKLKHPVTGLDLELEAPVPDDMKAVFPLLCLK